MLDGSWLMAQGSWLMARGGSWLMVRCRPGPGDPEARGAGPEEANVRECTCPIEPQKNQKLFFHTKTVFFTIQVDIWEVFGAPGALN